MTTRRSEPSSLNSCGRSRARRWSLSLRLTLLWPVLAEGTAAPARGGALGEVAEHGAVLVGVALLARRVEDLQAVVGREGPGLLVAVDRVQLRHRLHDGEQAQVVAGQEGGGRRDDADPSHRRELVVDEQALHLERRVLLRQVLRVQAHELREEQVEQRPGVGQPVRRDAHVDRHAPAAHVLEPEVVGARGRVDDRVREDRQRRVEGRDDARERVLRVRQQPLQRVDAFVRERLSAFARCDRAAQVILERLPLARRLAQHLADRFAAARASRAGTGRCPGRGCAPGR